MFDTFGSLTSETNAAVDCLLAFTAKPFDTKIELQYNINRWYEPTTGKLQA